MSNNLTNIINTVQQAVSAKRFAHIERVAVLAVQIALANGLSSQKAFLAGYLHDIAKEWTKEATLEVVTPSNAFEREHISTLHGFVGRIEAERLGITDPEVLYAVQWHVFGPEYGHRLAMALFVADLCEPGRNWGQDVVAVALAGQLDQAFAMAVRGKYEFLNERRRSIHVRLLDILESVQHLA